MFSSPPNPAASTAGPPEEARGSARMQPTVPAETEAELPLDSQLELELEVEENIGDLDGEQGIWRELRMDCSPSALRRPLQIRYRTSADVAARCAHVAGRQPRMRRRQRIHYDFSGWGVSKPPYHRSVGPTLSLSSPTACASCREARYVLGGIILGKSSMSGWLEDAPVLDDSLPDLPLLRDRAAAGCEFCGFLRSVVITEMQSMSRTTCHAGGQDEAKQMTVEIGFVNSLTVHAMAGFLRLPEGHFSAAISVRLIPGNETHVIAFDAFTHEEIIPPVLPSHLSEEVLEMVRVWVRRDCSQSRRDTDAGPAFMPTRLIDVHEGRLVAWPEPTQSPAQPYLALSYCWGPESSMPWHIRTTQHNLSERLADGIPVAQLPATLRDSLTMTRHLGYRYLWVDALCIVQDDAGDWQREAGAMMDVYRNAELTLSTPASAAADVGFLRRPVYHACKSEVLVSRSGGDRGPAIRTDTTDDAQIRAPIYFRYPALQTEQELVEQSEWNKRGWTFQERSLSRRTIHFTHQHLYFESSAGMRIEHTMLPPARGRRPPFPETPMVDGPATRSDNPAASTLWHDMIEAPATDIASGATTQVAHVRGPPTAWRAVYGGTIFWDPMFQARPPSSWLSSDRARQCGYQQWYEAVERFSVRKLTFSRDKLPALSGIARQCQTQLHPSDETEPRRQEYLAGLWRGDLHRGLLWRCSYARSTVIPQPQRAPSWSWAAFDGSICWLEDIGDMKPCVDILEARVSAEKGGLEVGSGRLVVRGSAYPVKGERRALEDGAGMRGVLTWSWPIEGHQGGKEPDVLLLPLLTGPGRFGRRSVAGLVLQPTGNHGDNANTGPAEGMDEYRRVGTFQIDDEPGLGHVGPENLHLVFDASGRFKRTICIV